MSLDYLANSDFEIAGTVLGELDMIKDIWFMSDKCQAKEVQKLEDEFKKDLSKLRFKTRVSIWKYIKDDAGSRKELEEGELKGPSTDTNYDNVVS